MNGLTLKEQRAITVMVGFLIASEIGRADSLADMQMLRKMSDELVPVEARLKKEIELGEE